MVGDNRFVAVFTSTSDRRHALEDGPWHFFQSLMVFREARGLQKPLDVNFDSFSIWVQLHNLPVAYMHPDIVKEIGVQIGIVEDMDIGDGGRCLGKYARVRVLRPIHDPLLRYLSVVLDDDTSENLILLLYEKLPDFCHVCGRIGHLRKDCTDREADQEKTPFGEWMKAKKESEGRRNRVLPPDYSNFHNSGNENSTDHSKDFQEETQNSSANSPIVQNNDKAPLNSARKSNERKEWKKRARDSKQSKGSTFEKRLKTDGAIKFAPSVNKEFLVPAEAATQPRRTL